VFIVGAGGTLLHLADHGTWLPLVSGTSSSLRGLWGASATDLTIVGLEGSIVHSP
jgi:hypothetical protein